MNLAPPKLPVTLLIPDWRQVDEHIPHDFKDDGSSDPVLMALLRKLRFIPWCRRTVEAIDKAARRHDYGFGPGRLPGSPYEGVPMSWWNRMYGQNIRDVNHPVIAQIHWRVLDRAGSVAWNRNWRKMQEWEWFTYDDFLKDPDHSYTANRHGMVDGVLTANPAPGTLPL